MLVTVLLYGTLIYSVFAELSFWTHAFGPSIRGLPTPLAVTLAVTLVYLPIPWFLWHGVEIFLRGRDAGLPLGHLGIFYTLLTIGRSQPELRRSQVIAIGGLCYFVAVMAAWIYYADARGL